jgi:P4 family phage/plasmid primase-like protien
MGSRNLPEDDSIGPLTIEIRPTFNVTLTEPDDIDFEPPFDYGPTPRFGWDNAVDIAEAKQICRDMAGGPLDNARGRRYIFDLAMRVRALGISKPLAVDLIHQYCTSPIPKGDVNEQVHSAYLVASSEPGIMSRARNAKSVGLIGSDPANPWPAATDEESARVWPKPLTYQGKDNAAKCAEVFLAERPDRLISSDSVLYSLECNRAWRALDDEELAAEMRATDPTNVLDVGKIFLMVKAIKLACFSKARPFEWIDKPDDAPEPNDLILAANGILNARTGDLIPHDGRYFATGLPEWIYDPDAEAPLFQQKLGEWLHASFHPTLQEFFGYALTADTSIEVLLAMIGAKRGGKGTLTRLLQGLVGKHHHASVMLNDLAGDFGLAGLMDKRAIFIPDAHDADLSRRSAAIERIKSITGSDEVSVNRKNQSVLSVKIPAKIVLVANRHPKFLDESGALADRELMIVFERSFAAVKDTELGTKLRAELSGIANWAIAGVRRLRANGRRFTIGERGRKAQSDLAEAQSPALRFTNDCLIVTGDAKDAVPLAYVFEAYEHWASTVESMSARERRNRTDFRTDLIAALGERGVTYTGKSRRWRNPRGISESRTKWFIGLRLKPGAIPTDDI